MQNKVIIIAPFWGQKNHVGVYRIDRFIRWFYGAGVEIVLVKAGSDNKDVETSWGREITIRDPLGLYRDNSQKDCTVKQTRKPNKIRRALAYILFNPDPTIVWAKRAAKHPLVLKYSKGAKWVLSSNPPESSHVAAAILAKKIQAKLMIDMRDGWLDEPLQPLLQTSKIQQWREGRLEKRILKQAAHIFVTSTVWKKLLEDRLPFTEGKTSVLTNGYPFLEVKNAIQIKKHNNKRIHLLYAGRFTGSRLSQKVSVLFEPMLIGMNDKEFAGSITLLGQLTSDDINEINNLKPKVESAGWKIELKAQVSRAKMMTLLSQADGLLLLSVSPAAIPSKIFEYIIVGKPILAVTYRNSAVWQLAKTVPQIFTLDINAPEKNTVRDYLMACSSHNYQYAIPKEFSEEYLSQLFLKEFNL